MRVLTINELMLLTRIELSDLAQRTTIALQQFAEGSPERANALTSLRNIGFVLARRDFSPRHAATARASGASTPRPRGAYRRRPPKEPPSGGSGVSKSRQNDCDGL
jgi:hypothetical protein